MNPSIRFVLVLGFILWFSFYWLEKQYMKDSI